MTNLTRRGLILGAAAFIAAPAIVRASSLMPVRPLYPEWKITGHISVKDLMMLSDFVKEHHIQPTKDGYYHAIGPEPLCPYIVTNGHSWTEQIWFGGDLDYRKDQHKPLIMLDYDDTDLTAKRFLQLNDPLYR